MPAKKGIKNEKAAISTNYYNNCVYVFWRAQSQRKEDDY